MTQNFTCTMKLLCKSCEAEEVWILSEDVLIESQHGPKDCQSKRKPFERYDTRSDDEFSAALREMYGKEAPFVNVAEVNDVRFVAHPKFPVHVFNPDTKELEAVSFPDTKELEAVSFPATRSAEELRAQNKHQYTDEEMEILNEDRRLRSPMTTQVFVPNSCSVSCYYDAAKDAFDFRISWLKKENPLVVVGKEIGRFSVSRRALEGVNGGPIAMSEQLGVDVGEAP